MATVVITFFLFARFYVCKMDADYQERPRDHTTSRRQNRWSMNSQRLEEIVAELMKPISDIRRSFDTDLSALLEEYLTEAGLHALDASEEEDSPAPAVAPNYAELALLLQHSASVYSRKVDFLYQHVLSVSEALNNTSLEESAAGEEAAGEGAGAEAAARRRRRASAPEHFAHIELEASAGARREPTAPRPPPTLPRMYIELEPRVLADSDAPLLDYAGEPVGLPSDFHVTWRLQDGFLVDELEGPRTADDSVLSPISLVELQAAIEAAAPPSPPPLRAVCERSPSPEELDEPVPLHASTPLPDNMLSPLKKERKRRSTIKIDDMAGGRIKIDISKELRRKLQKVQEFNLNEKWIAKVVERRKSRILVERRRLRAHEHLPPNIEFRGFDLSEFDVGGFLGWSGTEAALAVRAARLSLRLEQESDDDGFFEQSSVADSDHSRAEDLSANVALVSIIVRRFTVHLRARVVYWSASVVSGRGSRRRGGGERVAGAAGGRAGARGAGGAAGGGRGAVRGGAGGHGAGAAGRVAHAAVHAVPGERGQRGDRAGRGAVAGRVLGAAAVGGRAAVQRGGAGTPAQINLDSVLQQAVHIVILRGYPYRKYLSKNAVLHVNLRRSLIFLSCEDVVSRPLWTVSSTVPRLACAARLVSPLKYYYL